MKNRVIIIGGGAAGLMAAISAAKSGAPVTILEHNDRVGKKILSTGNGRCNFTNLIQTPDCYRSRNPRVAWKIVRRFDAHQAVKFFEELGIVVKNRDDYLYPYSEQATAILDVLRMEAERLDIQIKTGVHVKDLSRNKDEFEIFTVDKENHKKTYHCDAAILTTGSKAASKLGSDGSGYKLASKLGHSIVPVVPSLVQLQCEEKVYPALAGVRVQGMVSVMADDGKIYSDTGEIQLTNYGISGIPVFQISRYVTELLRTGQKPTVQIDFLPQMKEKELVDFLKKRMSDHPERTMDQFFIGMFNKKLAGVLTKSSGLSSGAKAGNLKEQEIQRMVHAIKHFKTVVKASNPFEQAQVCAGGVSMKEVKEENLESRLVKNLFFAGEVLDVDGKCGGYNLQWAWASGYIAGKGAADA